VAASGVGAGTQPHLPPGFSIPRRNGRRHGPSRSSMNFACPDSPVFEHLVILLIPASGRALEDQRSHGLSDNHTSLPSGCLLLFRRGYEHAAIETFHAADNLTSLLQSVMLGLKVLCWCNALGRKPRRGCAFRAARSLHHFLTPKPPRQVVRYDLIGTNSPIRHTPERSTGAGHAG
jgi:hypothetical protein